MTPTRREALQSTLGLLAAAAAPSIFAQPAYPASPIRFVISTPAGGGHDIMMRMIGVKLTEAWGQPSIVESKPGASGAIASTYVARAQPDGYTLLTMHGAVLTNLVLQPNPGYKLTDLVPVCMLVLTPLALGVRSSLGINTVQEYVARAKKQPGKLSYATYGQGSGAHFAGEQLNAAAGTDILHIPYKGEAPALQDMLGDQLDAVIVSLGGVSRYPGKIKPLAVASTTRSTRYPDVPTFSEAGFPGVNMPGWGAIFAPAGTPKAVANKLSAELNRIIMLPDVSAKMLELGFESVAWGPEKLAAFMNEQMIDIKKLVDSGRIKL
ncbi:MAG: tripartite tricarboxylate transporter substrate binding protein [Sulfuricaulis sp.]|nr:tripartite tricarboxylate transporter substrate binding protein [Sulfuricaulis sp.]